MGFGAKTRFLSSCKAKVVPHLLEWKEPWTLARSTLRYACLSGTQSDACEILPAKQGQHERWHNSQLEKSSTRSAAHPSLSPKCTDPTISGLYISYNPAKTTCNQSRFVGWSLSMQHFCSNFRRPSEGIATVIVSLCSSTVKDPVKQLSLEIMYMLDQFLLWILWYIYI